MLQGRSEVRPDGESVLWAAIRNRVSAYDAQLVVVAEGLGVSLVTGDRRLLQGCPGVAVVMDAFAAGA